MSGKATGASASHARRILIPHDLAPPPSPVVMRRLAVKALGGESMGTTWSVKLAVAPGTDLAPLQRAIETTLARIVEEMSTWEPDSHISRFNRAPPGTWHRLPDGFYTVLAAALHWAERTEGAYDPTLGAAVDLWGFGPTSPRHTRPDADEIAAAHARSGWSRLVLDAENRSALQPGGISLDLSSIAKGFAVDEVMRALRRLGIAGLLVEIGGELKGEGVKPDGSPWWIELERPRGACEVPETRVALAGHAIATSGDERRYFEASGRRYAHTLDPRTCAPVTHGLVSVTVLAGDCMTADALATALTVLGPGKGPAFAAEHRIAARFVSQNGVRLAEQLSPAMAAMLD